MLPEDPLTDHYAADQQEQPTTALVEEMVEQSESVIIIEDTEEEQQEDGVEPGEVAFIDEQPEDRMENWCEKCRSKLVFMPLGVRYNLLNCLRTLRPSHIVLYNTTIHATRIIEVSFSWSRS